MITLLLVIYFSLNSFFTGRFYEDGLRHTPKGLSAVINMSVGFLFALPVYLIFQLKNLCLLFMCFMDQYQIKFFFRYFFTQQTHNIDPDILYSFNMQVKYHRTTSSFKDRIYRKAINMLNNRNNYTFIEKEPEF